MAQHEKMLAAKLYNLNLILRMFRMFYRSLEDMSTMSDREFGCFLHLVLSTLLEVSMVKQTLSETDICPVSYSFQCHSYYRQNKTRVSFPALSHDLTL